MISEDAVQSLNPTTYAFGEFRLEAESLLLSGNSEVVSFTPKAYEILRALIEVKGNIVTEFFGRAHNEDEL